MAAAASPNDNPIIRYIKDELKSQTETQARLERELEVAKGMPAAQDKVNDWFVANPDVAKYVAFVKYKENMREEAIQRQLDEHYIGTPLEIMAWCIKDMRPRSASCSFGLSQKQQQLWNQLDRIANMVKHQKVPGPKACENLATLTGDPRHRDLGQRMQEAYDWIKQEKKKKNKE